MVSNSEFVRRLTRTDGAGRKRRRLAEPGDRRRRGETLQRLQFGVGGVAAMFLLVSLADAIERRADLAERAAVPEAVTSPSPPPSPAATDPLISAGVVPNLPDSRSSPSPASSGRAAAPPPAPQ
ncbi:hypothetical protein EYB45_00095 [Erythrobacteraceae bacterium CFH 75059]|uniref:hypothetical protein n=1 Tax=Qipengyuania thermophila TaxID=2509361 RepID=UPI0010200B87|nr:hypothetical protein [Qipengyuania thermophila]TCD06188.1 hypothetical protein EYB45_00095 [Erythrobacteraceae bacterium CFH 75059]